MTREVLREQAAARPRCTRPWPRRPPRVRAGGRLPPARAVAAAPARGPRRRARPAAGADARSRAGWPERRPRCRPSGSRSPPLREVYEALLRSPENAGAGIFLEQLSPEATPGVGLARRARGQVRHAGTGRHIRRRAPGARSPALPAGARGARRGASRRASSLRRNTTRWFANVNGSRGRSLRGIPRSCSSAKCDGGMSMHADLVKLLDLQAKDAAVAEVERRLEALRGEAGVLDQALNRARDVLETARRAAAEAAKRRDELEAKIESYRVLQDRRQQRLEHVRNPEGGLHADGRARPGAVGRGEGGERLGPKLGRGDAGAVQGRGGGAQRGARGGGPDARARTAGRAAARSWTASSPRPSRSARGDRVPARPRAPTPLRAPAQGALGRRDRARWQGGSCGSCHTSIPLNRRSQIRTGAIVDGLRGLRRDPVPTREREPGGMTLPGVTVSW